MSDILELKHRKRLQDEEQELNHLKNKTMSNIIQGKITKILDIEKGTSKAGKDWQKQAFVVDTGGEFNPEVCVSLFGDKIDMIMDYNVDSEVIVHINISSREFNNKYYHNIDGWKIEPVAIDTTQEAAPDDDSGLPF